MTRILIIAEHDNHSLAPQLACCVTAAYQIDPQAHVALVVIGYDCDTVVEQARLGLPIQEIILVEDARLQRPLAEPIALLVADLAKDAQYVLAVANTFGKNFLPRIAAKLNTCQISEVIAIDSPDTFKRPIYAGSAIATVRSRARCKVLTIRAAAFSAAKPPLAVMATIRDYQAPLELFMPTQWVAMHPSITSRPSLTSARIVVAGGRGLENAENFRLIERLADKLGAAVGATRAIVDAGFAPNDYQIGQTGKMIAPELYIAIGISGAVQHLAGIKDSKIIVAINKDPNALIFQVADYRLVGDLFAILPQLEQALDIL